MDTADAVKGFGNQINRPLAAAELWADTFGGQYQSSLSRRSRCALERSQIRGLRNPVSCQAGTQLPTLMAIHLGLYNSVEREKGRLSDMGLHGYLATRRHPREGYTKR